MIELIKKLCDIDSPSGSEEDVAEFILSEIKGYCNSCEIDNMGNVIAFKKGKNTPQNRTLVCAHMDEVGFIIKSISDDGMLKFGFVGGVDTTVAVGKHVRIGKVQGVIGIKAVHLTTASERKGEISTSSLYIDIGATSKADAESRVNIGDYGTFDSQCIEFGDGFLKAKGLDDKIGCAIMINIIKTELEFDTYFAFTVQEEVGLRGAITASYKVNPDIAIILETTTASDISSVKNEHQVCKVSDGVVIPFMDRATIYNQELFIKAREIAEKNNIKWQTKSVIAGGNDSGAVQKSRDGVKTIAFSAPTRYLHSPSSVAKISDILHTQKLAEAFLKEGIN